MNKRKCCICFTYAGISIWHIDGLVQACSISPCIDAIVDFKYSSERRIWWCFYLLWRHYPIEDLVSNCVIFYASVWETPWFSPRLSVSKSLSCIFWSQIVEKVRHMLLPYLLRNEGSSKPVCVSSYFVSLITNITNQKWEMKLQYISFKVHIIFFCYERTSGLHHWH